MHQALFSNPDTLDKTFDEAWFARHPWRRYRVRPASAAEVRERPEPAAAGKIWFAVVRQLRPGLHSRAFTTDTPQRSDDIGDAGAAVIWRGVFRAEGALRIKRYVEEIEAEEV